MKKKILIAVIAVLGIYGGITAQQNSDVNLLGEVCDCCTNASNPSCYVVYGSEVMTCGTGLNICDMEAPED